MKLSECLTDRNIATRENDKTTGEDLRYEIDVSNSMKSEPGILKVKFREVKPIPVQSSREEMLKERSWQVQDVKILASQRQRLKTEDGVPGKSKTKNGGEFLPSQSKIKGKASDNSKTKIASPRRIE